MDEILSDTAYQRSFSLALLLVLLLLFCQIVKQKFNFNKHYESYAHISPACSSNCHRLLFPNMNKRASNFTAKSCFLSSVTAASDVLHDRRMSCMHFVCP